MRKTLALAAVSALCLSATGVMAAGYQLNEYSVTGLGRAFAGAGVVGDDYSALAYNPAGMVLNKTSGIQGGLTVAHLNAKVRGTENGEYAKTKMNIGVTLPHAFGQYKVNDRLTAGFGIYAPFGLRTRYSKKSFVAEAGVRSELEVVDFAPAVAYRVTDKLSFGASVIARYIHGRMSNNVPAPYGGYSDFDLDGWTAAWSIGAMYEFTPDTRLGVSFKGKSMQTVKGDHKVSGSPYPINQNLKNGEASPDLPASLLVSGFHKLNDKWGLAASVRWTDWKDSFQEFTLVSPNAIILAPLGGKKTVQEKWRETWTVSFGTDYYLNENWTLRAGVAYDQSPVRNKYHRTIRIPDNNRIWLSMGASYTTKNWQFDAGYSHLFMQNGTSQYEGDPKAHFKSYSNLIGLQAQYKF